MLVTTPRPQASGLAGFLAIAASLWVRRTHALRQVCELSASKTDCQAQLPYRHDAFEFHASARPRERRERFNSRSGRAITSAKRRSPCRDRGNELETWENPRIPRSESAATTKSHTLERLENAGRNIATDLTREQMQSTTDRINTISSGLGSTQRFTEPRRNND
jgi:hypothetical protein